MMVLSGLPPSSAQPADSSLAYGVGHSNAVLSLRIQSKPQSSALFGARPSTFKSSKSALTPKSPALYRWLYGSWLKIQRWYESRSLRTAEMMNGWLSGKSSFNFRIGNANIFENISTIKTTIMEVVQCAFALIYMQKPVETISRGILGKGAGNLLREFVVRNPVHGLSQVLNKFMIPKQPLDPDFQRMSMLRRLTLIFARPRQVGRMIMNQFRPDVNYLEVTKRAGADLREAFKIQDMKNLNRLIRRESYWTKYDLNLKMTLEKDVLRCKQVLALSPKNPRLVKQAQKRIREATEVLNRIITFNYIQYTLYMLTFGLFAGIGVFMIVFKYFAPYDRYLETYGLKGLKKIRLHEPPPNGNGSSNQPASTNRAASLSAKSSASTVVPSVHSFKPLPPSNRTVFPLNPTFNLNNPAFAFPGAGLNPYLPGNQSAYLKPQERTRYV